MHVGDELDITILMEHPSSQHLARRLFFLLVQDGDLHVVLESNDHCSKGINHPLSGLLQISNDGVSQFTRIGDTRLQARN